MAQARSEVSLDIESLMNEVRKGFPFIPEKYSQLSHCRTEGEILQFCIDHILKHVVKQTGKIATEMEAFDHGRPTVNVAELEKAAAKLLVNALNLANVLRIDPKRLVAMAVSELH